MELLKKLFKKLGKQQTEEKELKSKTIRLTTNIAINDLENKKRKAVEFMKTTSTLKFFMKVNIYDDENVQKGKLMLMNIAEEMKEYAKIKVSPMEEGAAMKAAREEADRVDSKKPTGKKPSTMDEIQKQANSQKVRKGELASVEDGDEEDFDSMGNHIYMELQSTVAFKEVDIDQMLQHTSMDDFLRGLYVRATNAQGVSTGKPVSQHDKLLAQLMDTRDENKEDAKSSGKPTLDFEDGNKSA